MRTLILKTPNKSTSHGRLTKLTLENRFKLFGYQYPHRGTRLASCLSARYVVANAPLEKRFKIQPFAK